MTPSAARLRAIGVLAAGRLLVDRPEAAERVELVGERDGDRHWRRRNPVVRPLRLIVLLDRGGDARLLALAGRVIAAHQALQLGKLADHFGDEIGLGEPGGARRKLDVGPHLRRDLPRKLFDALDPFGLRAELFVEDDAERLELGEALVERLCGLVLIVGQVVQVGQPEVAGVGEAGAHDARVAGGDRGAAVAGDQVRNEDEAIGEPAVGPPQDEAFLVGADGGAHDLGRNVEIVLFEFAHQDDRPFDQAGDLLD